MHSSLKRRLTQRHHSSPEALAVPIGVIGTESMPPGPLGWILLVRHLAPLVVGDGLTLLVRAEVPLLLVDVMGHWRQELWDIALVEPHHIVGQVPRVLAYLVSCTVSAGATLGKRLGSCVGRLAQRLVERIGVTSLLDWWRSLRPLRSVGAKAVLGHEWALTEAVVWLWSRVGE